MKKSIMILSASVALLGIGLTACGKSDIVTDKDGKTHVIVTQKGGEVAQDPWGNLYEKVTDRNGETVTQVYDFPAIKTNRFKTKVENGVLTVKVPGGWEISDANVMRLRHKNGKCVKADEPPCQIELTYRSDRTRDEVYEIYMNYISKLRSVSENISAEKSFNVKICGIDAKAFSYHMDDTDSTVYYFCVAKGETVVEITADIYDECYDEKSITELINSCVTLKELPSLTTLPAETTAEATNKQ